MSSFPPKFTSSITDALPVRVLVVDDSVVMRSALEHLLEDSSDIALVGNVATTADAYAFLRSHEVDIVLLDHEMPTQKGLDALPEMMRAAKGAHIVLLSSHCQRGSKIAVTALSLGASDTIEKPSRTKSTAQFTEMLKARLRRLAASRRISGQQDRIAFRSAPSNFNLRCIGIGASTGGIHALAEFLGSIRSKPGVPILVTQHLPVSFIPYYAQQVARMSELPVVVAEAGIAFRPDHIYIAPGDTSLSCRVECGEVRAVLMPDRDPITHARPSVNFMFSGIAQCYGHGAVGIVFTGIGRDGTAGARHIVDAGGVVLVQDQRSSVVWGMPGSIVRAGLASAAIGPTAMFGYVSDLCEARL